MKYVILTSSIFYLLGLKFTANIDINAKLQPDSVQQKKEIIQIPKEIKGEKLQKEVLPTKKDSVVASSAGSDEFLAPYVTTRVN